MDFTKRRCGHPFVAGSLFRLACGRLHGRLLALGTAALGVEPAAHATFLGVTLRSSRLAAS
jgi:hypothetical protein